MIAAVYPVINAKRNSFTARGDETEPAVTKWVDYMESPEEMDRESEIVTEAPGFPGVTFCYTPERITASKTSGSAEMESSSELITGMPIWNAYFYDVTGDGIPEICATVSVGSGIIDERIVLYDYANGASYKLADRGNYDYCLRLNEEDGYLYVDKKAYPGDKPVSSGRLVFQDGCIRIEEEKIYAASRQPDIVVWKDADLDHDGIKETIYVREAEEGALYELSVVKEDGTLLWSTEAGLVHAGWNTILLYEEDGEDYLLRYQPTMYQGMGNYVWTQFSLEGGRETEVNSMSVEFELPLRMNSKLRGFAERTDWMLESSTVLLSTEQGEAVIGPQAAADVPQLYPVRFGPDETEDEDGASVSVSTPVSLRRP